MSIADTYLGQGLNTPQRLAVKAALARLRVNENLQNVRFWGKIYGSQKDYFLAMATSVNDQVTKSFYYSADDGLTFAKLTPSDDWVRGKCASIRRVFTGNTAFIYKDKKPKTGEEGEEEEEEEEPEEEEEEDEDGEKKPKKDPMDPQWRKLNELERLAYAVECIEQDTCIAPVGAFYLTPTGEIQSNSSFKGLSSGDAQKIGSYVLFRDPTNARTLARIRKGGVTNNKDFLDRVVEETPVGVWTIQADDSAESVGVRNLAWPGFEAKFVAGSPIYTSAYFGGGEKNVDIIFML